MSEIYLTEMRLNTAALVNFARDRGLLHPTGDEDLGYAVHAWLLEAFGPHAPRPWRLLMDGRRPTRVLGYSSEGAGTIWRIMEEFSNPGVLAVCPEGEKSVQSKKMPSWASGRHLGFEVLCCPVGRASRSGVERDIFLMKPREGDGQSRETVYATWVRNQIDKLGGATVDSVNIRGFRLVRLLRRPEVGEQSRRPAVLVRPSVLAQGHLTVTDPVGFGQILVRGIGRHRAFGFGMLLLRPPHA